jgi:HhH-GPD superfamily base excision DNA repair protein
MSQRRRINKQSANHARPADAKISRFFQPVKRPHPANMDEPLGVQSIIDLRDCEDTANKRQKNDPGCVVASSQQQHEIITSNADDASTVKLEQGALKNLADEAHQDANDKESVPVNPFQRFAFAVSTSSCGEEASGSLPVFSITKSKHYKSGTLPLQRSTHNDHSRPKKSTKTQSHGSKTATSDWIRMKDIPAEEQEGIVHKWHTMADPTASLEDKRFQILVAARLHARCQDGPVRKAMKELRSYFDSSNQQLTVKAMATADPDDLHTSIKNLQYYITKAANLVKAAQELKVRYGGRVPEDEHSLKQITGIGPVLADLLAFVNTRARHREALAE